MSSGVRWPTPGMDGQVALGQAGDRPLGHLERGRRVVAAPDQVDGTADGVELRLVGLVDGPDEHLPHEPCAAR